MIGDIAIDQTGWLFRTTADGITCLSEKEGSPQGRLTLLVRNGENVAPAKHSLMGRVALLMHRKRFATDAPREIPVANGRTVVA